MTTIGAFNLCVGVLLVWCALYAIYLNFFRRVLHTRFRFQISAIKDDLNLLLLAGKVDRDDGAYVIIRRRIQIAEKTIGSLSLTNILLGLSRGNLRPASHVIEEDETIAHSSNELVAIKNRLDLAVIGTLASNSPLLLGAVIVMLSGLALWWMVAAVAKKKMTEIFWDAIYFSNMRPQRITDCVPA